MPLPGKNIKNIFNINADIDLNLNFFLFNKREKKVIIVFAIGRDLPL